MTTIENPTPATTDPGDTVTGSVEQRPGPAHVALQLVAGVALVGGVAAFFAGMLTTPSQASESSADYIASLARNPMLSAVSAILLHYGDLMIGMGLLAAPSLVRGGKGFRFTLVGALLGALGFVNTSGEILADWWNIAGGTLLPSEQAVQVFEAARGGLLMGLWKGTEIFAFVGVISVLIGLLRAGVVRWWAIAVFVVGVIALFSVPVSLPWVQAAILLVTFAPLGLIGLLLIGRWRVGRGPIR